MNQIIPYNIETRKLCDIAETIRKMGIFVQFTYHFTEAMWSVIMGTEDEAGLMLKAVGEGQHEKLPVAFERARRQLEKAHEKG